MSDPSSAAMGMGGGGSALNAYSLYQSGKQAKAVGKHNKRLAYQAAGQEEAVSQIEAAEAKRQGDIVKSRVLALVAASGGNAMDPDVMNALAGFENESDLAARTSIYEGSENARVLRAKGDMGEYEADALARQRKIQAASTLMKGGASMASKYGEANT